MLSVNQHQNANMSQDKKLSEYNDDGSVVVMRQNTLYQQMMADSHIR